MYERIIVARQNPLKCGNGDRKAWPRKYPAALEINTAKDSALSRNRPLHYSARGHVEMRENHGASVGIETTERESVLKPQSVSWD
jgi:hypothetical protein